MIYLEILQKFITAATISFSGAIISDSGSGFADFSAGDKIIIKGSLNGANDGFRKIHTATSASITVLGADFTAESAGNSIEIYKIEFFSDPATMHDDERGVTRFYNPGILSIGEISRTADGAFVRLNDGAITLNRKYLLGKNIFDSPDGLTAFDLQDKTKLFTFTIRLSYDDTKLFDGVIGIIRQLDEMGVTFQLKTQTYDTNYLLPAPNINSTTSFTQQRLYPKLASFVEFYNPLLMNDSTFEYYVPLGLIFNVRDDGVIVPFQNVSTSYTLGSFVYYNKKRYSRSTSGGTATMSPTGAATNNADWNYVSDGGIDNFFATDSTFNLFSTPVGEITVNIIPSAAGSSGSYDEFMQSAAALISIPGNFIIGDGIAFDNLNSKITDTENQLGVFCGAGTNIHGQQILIIGGANDGIKYEISSVSSDGSEITLTTAPINEAAGTIIKIQGYFGLDYSAETTSALVTDSQKTQVPVIEKMKQISELYNQFFYADKERKLIVAVGKASFSDEYDISDFNIDLDGGVSYLTKEIISSYSANISLRAPIESPVKLTTIEVDILVSSGISSGVNKKANVSVGVENASTIKFLLEETRDLYLNYDRIELKYTIDGPGIDTRLKPGVKLNFDAWISGDLYVQEVIWNIEQGQNIVRGIANNIVFKDVE